MTTVVKIVIALILSFLMTSCNFNFGVRGNGKVKTVERPVNGTFSSIEVSRGMDVYLTQSDHESVTVQADENLHNLIKTEIEGTVLKIYTEENINYSEAQKVMVSFKTLSKIKATSGSDVHTTNTIKVDVLSLETSSGSDMELDLVAHAIECQASSGSDLELSGTTTSFIAEASSGSDIDASDLKTETSRVKSTSGADISVYTTKDLYAKANSGGTINYSGNPSKVEKSDTVSGSISQK